MVGSDIQILIVCLLRIYFLQHTVNCRNMVGFSYISLALKPWIFKKVNTRFCLWECYNILQFTNDFL